MLGKTSLQVILQAIAISALLPVVSASLAKTPPHKPAQQPAQHRSTCPVKGDALAASLRNSVAPSGGVFVSRADRGLNIRSLRDPGLHNLTIGIPLLGESESAIPPALALAELGIVHNVRGYMVADGAAAGVDPVEAVRSGEVDIAVVWGPTTANRPHASPIVLTISPIADVAGFEPLRFAFDIALGVRKGDSALKQRLDEALERRADAIRALLRANGVPLVSANDQSMR